jgi:hypothetical protein
MNIKLIPFLFALFLTILITVTSVHHSTNNFVIVYTIGVFFTTLILLSCFLAINFKDQRKKINLRTVGFLFFLVNLFIIYNFSESVSSQFYFIISCAFLLLFFFAFFYFLTPKFNL